MKLIYKLIPLLMIFLLFSGCIETETEQPPLDESSIWSGSVNLTNESFNGSTDYVLLYEDVEGNKIELEDITYTDAVIHFTYGEKYAKGIIRYVDSESLRVVNYNFTNVGYFMSQDCYKLEYNDVWYSYKLIVSDTEQMFGNWSD